MNPVEAGCPACGAPIRFRIGSSIVTICEFCNSAVARGDRRLEDLGKVAALIETGSPLEIGLRGVYRGIPFEITGRAQLGHQAGGMWDEWYAAFQNGQWGWIAEAQGRFYVTFQQPALQQAALPSFDSLTPGQPFNAFGTSYPFVVAEKGWAKALGAKGEIPYKLAPGEMTAYADLSGPQGLFGTLDYSEARPLVFLGREVPFQELGIIGVPTHEREVRRISATQLNCPKCAGPLSLRAPDHAERVTCPNCGSLLDVTQGKLQFLSALKGGKIKPIFPIGSVGEFSGVKYTVIGFVQRSVKFDKLYYWEEYLLYNPEVGFRWLVRSDDNWNFVQSVPPGEVIDNGKSVTFGGKRFKLYQDATGKVEYVEGEFYWKVAQGETNPMADYVRPPLMLSKEISVADAAPGDRQPQLQVKKGKKYKNLVNQFAGEINWSLGVYLRREEVEKAFGIKGLPKTSKIAPNQLFPHKKIYKYWGLLLLAAFVLGLFFIATGSYRTAFEQSYALEPVAAADKTQVRFSEPFEVRANQNIKVSLSANVSNSWAYVEGDLINEETGLVQGFSIPVEYYFGVDGGESWSEGSNQSSTHISSLPAGRYTLRLEAQWEKWQQPLTLSVKVQQGVPRILHIVLVLIAISIFPLLVAIRHYSFEVKRWADSDYSPFSSG